MHYRKNTNYPRKPSVPKIHALLTVGNPLNTYQHNH